MPLHISSLPELSRTWDHCQNVNESQFNYQLNHIGIISYRRAENGKLGKHYSFTHVHLKMFYELLGINTNCLKLFLIQQVYSKLFWWGKCWCYIRQYFLRFSLGSFVVSAVRTVIYFLFFKYLISNLEESFSTLISVWIFAAFGH